MSNPVIDEQGTKRWYNSKGELHRWNGPAVECVGGYKSWFVDGKCHRLDGPAWEWADGSKWWYVEGVRVAEKDYPAAVLLYKCRMVLES